MNKAQLAPFLLLTQGLLQTYCVVDSKSVMYARKQARKIVRGCRMSFDPYSVLGVLPGADQVVISAAYRALAQRYHPDKWQGDPKIAHDRMAAINKAYEMIGNAEARAKYDAELGTKASGEFYDDDTEKEEAFDFELKKDELDWELALDIYPDLERLRRQLGKISISLSFGFVKTMLARKDFEQRFKIADQLEKDFFIRYFGSDSEINAFAKEIILSGHKEAALKLNKYISVLGSKINTKAVITRIKKDYFAGGDPDYDIKKDLDFVKDFRKNYAKLKASRDVYLALDLARLMNYKIVEAPYLFGTRFVISTGKNITIKIDGVINFVDWILNEFKNI